MKKKVALKPVKAVSTSAKSAAAAAPKPLKQRNK